MDNLSWADIRQALETAAAELRKVERTWTEDANTVASAAASIDPNRRRYLRDPERLNDLRQALQIIEGLLDDVADAEGT